jgi:hypothetical protein
LEAVSGGGPMKQIVSRVFFGALLRESANAKCGEGMSLQESGLELLSDSFRDGMGVTLRDREAAKSQRLRQCVGIKPLISFMKVIFCDL